MTEARDISNASLVVLEAAQNLQRAVHNLNEERQQLDWTIERLRTERLALDDSIYNLTQLQPPEPTKDPTPCNPSSPSGSSPSP